MYTVSTNKERKLDIVFCIDCSAGMADHLSSVRKLVKEAIRLFVWDFSRKNDSVKALRAKIIRFGNYESDGAEAILQSRFFDLQTDEEKQFDDFLNSLQAKGGIDGRSNGLEALFYAMTADWAACEDTDRQIIFLFSNADAAPMNPCGGHLSYPAHMVDEEGLLNTWMCVRPAFLDRECFKLKERNKRMVLVAPEETIYETMMGNFNRCQFLPTSADARFADIDLQELFRW